MEWFSFFLHMGTHFAWCHTLGSRLAYMYNCRLHQRKFQFFKKNHFRPFTGIFFLPEAVPTSFIGYQVISRGQEMLRLVFLVVPLRLPLNLT